MRGATILLTSCSLAIASCAETQDIHVRAVGAPSAKTQFSGGLLAQGRGQLALGNAGTALETFRKLLREQPESADAFAGVAACYVAMGRYDLARTNFEFALAYAPNDVGLLTSLASSLDRLGEAKQAVGVRAEVAAMRAASAALAEAQAPAVTPVAVPHLVSVTVKLPPAPPPVQNVASLAQPPVQAVAAPAQPPVQVVAAPEIGKPVLSNATVTLPATGPAILKKPTFDAEVAIAGPVTNDSPSQPPVQKASVPAQPPVQVASAPEIGKAVLSGAAVTLPATRAAVVKNPTFDAEVAIAIPVTKELPAVPSLPAAKPLPMPAEKPREVAVTQAEPYEDGSPYLTRSSPGVVSLITRPTPVWVAQSQPLWRVRASPVLKEAAKIAQADSPPALVPAGARWVPLKFASAPANIRILNAARSQSLAARSRSALLDRGWRKIAIGNARQVRLRSLVLYTPARAAVARRLAAHFRCKAVKVEGADRVVVLLGRDAALRKQGLARA